MLSVEGEANFYRWLSAVSHVSSDAQRKLKVQWSAVKIWENSHFKSNKLFISSIAKKKNLIFPVFLYSYNAWPCWTCTFVIYRNWPATSACVQLKPVSDSKAQEARWRRVRPLDATCVGSQCVEHATHLHGQCVSFMNSSRWSFRVCSKKGSYARVLEKLFLPHTHTCRHNLIIAKFQP